MQKIKTLIIDDEILACDELEFLMKDFEDFEVVGSLQDWKEALNFIEEKQPHLLLLDIELGEKNGFELLESLEEVPEVIFITAYHQYALKAFDFNALDYLLKPIDEQRLQRALEKVKNTLKNQQEKLENKTKKEGFNIQSKVFIKDGEDCFFVPIQEVYLIETVGNYSRIFFKDKKPLLHKSLNLLEEKLPSEMFFRANRSQIINLNFIKEIHPNFKSKLLITLLQGKEIEISIRQSVRFRELMSF